MTLILAADNNAAARVLGKMRGAARPSGIVVNYCT